MGKYDYNENEKFDTFYLEDLQPALKKYNLSLQCMRDFVLMMKRKQPLNQMQNLFEQLNDTQKYGLLNIHIDTGTDGLFESNLQWYPPYGKDLEVAKQYDCSNDIKKFLTAQLAKLHCPYNKGAMAGFFAKVGLPHKIGLYAGDYINRKDASALSITTKLAADSAREEERIAINSVARDDGDRIKPKN